MDWVVFTSANGVEQTWRVLAEEGLGNEAFGAARFAVVGTATGEALAARGVAAQLVAREHRGEGVAAALLEAMTPWTGEAPRVLILRAQEARDVLPNTLLEAGVRVEVVAVYRTRPSAEGAAEIERRLAQGGIDAVVFSSGSTVDSICDALGQRASSILADITVASIGPVTTAAAAARGVRVDVEPQIATFADAIAALDAHFRAI
jgi:uroporphyrinogen III methyltransferase/synthase